jgi:hypothetical protein
MAAAARELATFAAARGTRENDILPRMRPDASEEN